MIDRACLSLNHQCNLRCRYCHFAVKAITTEASALAFSPYEAVKVIDNIVTYCQINGLKQFKLGIVGSGEPLLSYATLQTVVERAEQADGLFKLYTITNGVALTDAQLAFFYDHRAIIALHFSLDGYEEIHNDLRQGYQQTMEAICRYEKQFKHKPGINATVTRKSIENKRRLVGFFLENGFFVVNFSIVVDVADPALVISRAEYEDFLDYCARSGIVMRQKCNDRAHSYDCTMFGRLCGVGHTNIFITKNGIYPCGRFFGLDEYKLADYDTPISAIASKMRALQRMDSNDCYYDTLVRKQR